MKEGKINLLPGQEKRILLVNSLLCLFEEVSRDKELTFKERRTDEKERTLDRMDTFCFCYRFRNYVLSDLLRKDKNERK